MDGRKKSDSSNASTFHASIFNAWNQKISSSSLPFELFIEGFRGRTIILTIFVFKRKNPFLTIQNDKVDEEFLICKI